MVGNTAGRGDDHNVPREHRAGAMPKMKITWRDGSKTNQFGAPIARPLSKGSATARDDARAAAEHLRRIDGMLRERWNRAGWDDRGGNLTAIVNQTAMGGNAYFMMTPSGKGELGIGTKDKSVGFKESPAHSPSILFHELVHGMMYSELQGMPAKVMAKLGGREFGAVAESMADVISTGMLRTHWKNGQEIRGGDPLRDLTDPSIPKWTHAVEKDFGIEEHSLSGIFSRAATIAADEIGTGGTSAVVDAWYSALDRRFRSELMRSTKKSSGGAMGAWVRATMQGAETVAGRDSDLVKAMRKGWKKVGLGQYATVAQSRRGAPPANPR